VAVSLAEKGVGDLKADGKECIFWGRPNEQKVVVSDQFLNLWSHPTIIMNLSAEIAKHLRNLYYGGNYTGVNFKDTLGGVSWKQASTKVHSFNTIVALVYHINYYVIAVSNVLRGQPLDGSDQFSFDHPEIKSEGEWKTLLTKFWADAEDFALLIEQLPDERLSQPLGDGKYGSMYRNIAGVIEHANYHLGQIVLIKKLVS
jgi:SPX domain protein involved in polyphosphate accumulation